VGTKNRDSRKGHRVKHCAHAVRENWYERANGRSLVSLLQTPMRGGIGRNSSQGGNEMKGKKRPICGRIRAATIRRIGRKADRSDVFPQEKRIDRIRRTSVYRKKQRGTGIIINAGACRIHRSPLHPTQVGARGSRSRRASFEEGCNDGGSSSHLREVNSMKAQTQKTGTNTKMGFSHT